MSEVDSVEAMRRATALADNKVDAMYPVPENISNDHYRTLAKKRSDEHIRIARKEYFAYMGINT